MDRLPCLLTPLFGRRPEGLRGIRPDEFGQETIGNIP